MGIGIYSYAAQGRGVYHFAIPVPDVLISTLQLCRSSLFSCNEIAIAAIMKASLVLPFMAAAAAALDLTVTTSRGRITGHNAPEAEGVYEFLGVPFAKPPVGELRFAPPAELGSVASSVVFVADKFVRFSGAERWRTKLGKIFWPNILY